ncbi:MAG: hypothetical protein ABSH41_30470 [Syntrophobacteraceae bacterium]
MGVPRVAIVKCEPLAGNAVFIGGKFTRFDNDVVRIKAAVKKMGSESKLYYKLVIKETGESFGPISARPLFSPPATQFQPPKQIDSVLVLR